MLLTIIFTLYRCRHIHKSIQKTYKIGLMKKNITRLAGDTVMLTLVVFSADDGNDSKANNFNS
jgi:hypothetical protein